MKLNAGSQIMNSFIVAGQPPIDQRGKHKRQKLTPKKGIL